VYFWRLAYRNIPWLYLSRFVWWLIPSALLLAITSARSINQIKPQMGVVIWLKTKLAAPWASLLFASFSQLKSMCLYHEKTDMGVLKFIKLF
jgi:hypothetical protein